MHIETGDDGSFIFVFRADEVDLGIQLLTAIEPANEQGEAAIQRSIDMLIECGTSQHRTIN